MRVLRVSALNGAAVAVRMVTGLASNKLLALFVGPGGYPVIGQFQNALTVATTFAGSAISQGVVRYTAEYGGDAERSRRLWRTAGAITLGGCLVAGLALVLARNWLAMGLLRDASRGPVFVALALGLVPLGLNALLLAILNGRQETRRYVLANIAGSLAGLALTAALAATLGLTGALLAVALNQSVAVVATVLIARRSGWLRARDLIGWPDPVAARALGRYAVMALVAATAGPAAQTVIRQHIIGRLGLEPAGIWDGMNRVSAMGLLFFTATLQVYYLPRIAELRNNGALRAEVRQLLRLIVPTVALALALGWALRGWLVPLLFDRRFLPMTALFAPQFVGDFLKIISWIFSFVMVGRGWTTVFVLSEIGFAVIYAAAAIAGVDRFGLRGASAGYALTYAVYLVAMARVFERGSRTR